MQHLVPQHIRNQTILYYPKQFKVSYIRVNYFKSICKFIKLNYAANWLNRIFKRVIVIFLLFFLNLISKLKRIKWTAKSWSFALIYNLKRYQIILKTSAGTSRVNFWIISFDEAILVSIYANKISNAQRKGLIPEKIHFISDDLKMNIKNSSYIGLSLMGLWCLPYFYLPSFYNQINLTSSKFISRFI